MGTKADWAEELGEVVAEARVLLDAAGATLEGLEEDAANYVRKHPWQSLGLAAAVGLLVGVLVSRRH